MMNLLGKIINTTESSALVLDRFMNRVAILIVIITLLSGVSAFGHIAPEGVVETLSSVKFLLRLANVIVIILALIDFIKLRISCRGELREDDSFISDTFRRAGFMAFALTFVFLTLLIKILENYTLDLPVEFFLKGSISVSLGLFSVTYFFLYMKSRGDEEEDDYFEGPDV